MEQTVAAIQFIRTDTAAWVSRPGRVLAQAATDALSAPSILNSQPWRWRISDDVAALHADRSRQVRSLDPDGRLLTISCGTALHHARIALAAAGHEATATYLPDTGDPDLLATIRLGDPVPPRPEILRLYRAMWLRRTDRRPYADTPVPVGALDVLRKAAETQGAHLHFPRPHSVITLAVAAGHAASQELADPAYRSELAGWVARGEHGSDGVPASTATPTTARPVPVRDFTGTHGPPTIHDRAPMADRYAVYAVLFTDGDRPRDWLVAGEALSAVLLTATAAGLATSPMSDLIEVPASRQLVRDLLTDLGHPAMVIRIGLPVTPLPAPSSPRRNPGDAVDLSTPPGGQR